MNGTLLPEGEVHLWCTNPASLGEGRRADDAVGMLSPDERAQLATYRFEGDRLLYLAAHALVRTTLSRYHPRAPGDWRFEQNAQGKPAIVGPGEFLRFNAAHTHGLAVCAVTRSESVGVDVEELVDEVPRALIDHALAATEIADLAALDGPARAHRFLEYWTLKESYVKARGLGLTLPLDRFSFSLEADRGPVLHLDPRLGDDPRAWQFVQQRPTPQHLLALCVHRRPGEADRVVRWHGRAPTAGSS